MSQLLINQYYTEVERIIQYSGSRNESSIRFPFQNLLNEYCKSRDFILIPELEYKTKTGKKVVPDGTVKDALRLDWGFWESKDENDILDEEIEKKLAKGYPDDNILFEDSQTAVLIQAGSETSRVSMKNPEDLDGIINAFINYIRPEVKDFREAIATFQSDLPTILESLRSLIAEQSKKNQKFCQARDKFLTICRDSINPEVSLFDVQEMIIQHILTEDIFLNIFNESQFHRENNIARELEGVLNTFFTGTTRRNTLSSIERYYGVIKSKAASIYNHHEKQEFLKVVYENFYKSYNPLGADRLGIVYTPTEIVRFMIESVDYLVDKHFGKLLCDEGVKILDPATGTGTFITELIEYLPENKLEYKYQHEIFCNEVAILPYYIANLNIEYTYQQKKGSYEEFNNICFVDTLDHSSFEGKQLNLFAMTVENTERIKRQNDCDDISVIIGNPPYNANQANENDNNKNRAYSEIDKLIKSSYVKESRAQKTKVYDMYSRFFRWATDRLGKNGVLAFITNSSFINAKTFDGFRKLVAQEFSHIYVIDLGGDVRKNPKLSGTKHNVFGIQTGVAISFMVKKDNHTNTPCKIFYIFRPEFETAKDKLKFLAATKFSEIDFEHIQPDKNNNWINLTDNDFDSLLPLANKNTKLAKNKTDETAIFKVFTLGILTSRDEWLYDFDSQKLAKKVQFFCDFYEQEKVRWNKSNNKKAINDFVDRKIKWTSELEEYLLKNSTLEFNPDFIVTSTWRPFTKKYLYLAKIIVHRLYQQEQIFPIGKDNIAICLTIHKQVPFVVQAANTICDGGIGSRGSQIFTLYYYDENGKRQENITDWSLQKFQTHYNNKRIKKLDIFHYTYAVLHYPTYRQKYEQNLKREFPRLPFYENFQQWVKMGKKLINLHINYETIKPFPLTRIDLPTPKNSATSKPKLKADKTKDKIFIDTITTLEKIPKIAWEYRLGNRSALEWILDQYKEKKPRDKTIAEKFNTYCFADYKETVIDLLQKVCTVSVETMKIIQAMENVGEK
ncbi:type ISP restriction/modification enzyme [Okeania sp.]|uniref:type ISP restriction/modification enzyme n=1 Tax=Okeania sp. TaxID=3100323 RepID=UPI002B4B9614|nr:type ISP restriction/modification enzyme [Okeania sp.]MEB3342239.1 type ISP restriction/modification enzyme [Okeania sp.]